MMQQRKLRFGPEPQSQAANELKALQAEKELDRIIREMIERLKISLWFWEDGIKMEEKS